MAGALPAQLTAQLIGGHRAGSGTRRRQARLSRCPILQRLDAPFEAGNRAHERDDFYQHETEQAATGACGYEFNRHTGTVAAAGLLVLLGKGRPC